MQYTIGTREQLLADLAEATAPGEPLRLLVMLRLGGYKAFIDRFGSSSTDALLDDVVSSLPAGCGPSEFYSYRPRKDELCGLIAGRLDGVEKALYAAARTINDSLGRDGITLGYGTAVLPYEASNAVGALRLADRRIIGITDGNAIPRATSGDWFRNGHATAA